MRPNITQVFTDENLYAAWVKVSTNQGSAGSDGETLAEFSAQLWLNLQTLRNEVIHRSYQPKPLLRINIPKSSSADTRPLSIPSVRDRVLQTAVTQVLTPIFELKFEQVSFAYRKGRSVDQAVRMIVRLRDKGYKWVVDADIKRYFDEVDHALLIAEIQKIVDDETILRLIRQWLHASVVEGKRIFKLAKGIPQGSPISPLLANLYLDQLDDALLQKNLRIVRYADDFLVLCKSAKQAEKALKITAEVLERLKLRFNEDKTHITEFNRGFRFLGVEFIRSFAFASDYQDAPRAKISPAIKQKRPTQPQPKPPPTALAEAFAEEGLTADQFPETALSENEDSRQLSQHSGSSANSDESSYQLDPILQTLFLTRHGVVLGREYQRFTVKYNDQLIATIPAIHVDQIMVFGNSQITTQAMQFCLQERIPIYLLSAVGHYYGAIESFDTEPVRLHKQQFLVSDDQVFCLKLAGVFIEGKLRNSQLILKRYARHHALPEFESAAKQLSHIINRAPTATSLDQLRGYEGNAARVYFQALVGALDSKWQFTKRVKNPPTDPVNALLSYGYTLLFYNVYSLLRMQGLNPHVGFLHPIRMGHPALASDLMEEFRSIIVDSVVFNLLLNERLNLKDFSWPNDSQGACWIGKTAKHKFINALEQKFNSPITHPNSGLKIDYRRAIAHQVRQLAAVIRGTESDYQPMILR